MGVAVICGVLVVAGVVVEVQPANRAAHKRTRTIQPLISKFRVKIFILSAEMEMDGVSISRFRIEF